MEDRNKLIILSAGGTGGHIFPLISVCEYLKKKGLSTKKGLANSVDFIWIGGDTHSMEARIAKEHNIPFICLPIKGFRGKSILSQVKSVLMLFTSLIICTKIFLQRRPSLVITFGGYASISSAIVAIFLRVPLFIQEQNSVAGLTNRLLSRFAKRAFSGIPSFKHKNLSFEFIGNPVREDITSMSPPSDRYEGRSGRIRVLVLGGSLGAFALNEAIVHWLSSLPASNMPFVIHQAGEKHTDSLNKAYENTSLEQKLERRKSSIQSACKMGSVNTEEKAAIHIFSFIDDMKAAYEWADLVICRSGASTVSEISVSGLPAIFVPFPYAVDNHQYYNAQLLVQAKSAEIILQKDLNTESINGFFNRLGINYDAQRVSLQLMAQRSYELGRRESLEKIRLACKEHICDN